MTRDSELASVKATVKAWERAFRAEHGRDPGKADIKTDKSDIAEQYALYRKLSKSLKSSSSRSGGGNSTGNGTSRQPTSYHGDREAARNGQPSTPTPPRRRSTVPSSPPPQPELLSTVNGEKKRGAPMTPQRTPKRSKPYAGPVYDPNPNPFSVTPKKRATPAVTSPFKAFAESARAASSSQESMSSPFIIANSPKKLQALLKANSLQARQARAEVDKNTPRTRARKRLAGEIVDDSPVAVRRRGVAKASTSAEPFDDAFETMEADEDEFGETPVKTGVDTFSLLGSGQKIQQPNLGAPAKSRGKEGVDLFPMFKRVASAKYSKGSSSPPAEVEDMLEQAATSASPSVSADAEHILMEPDTSASVEAEAIPSPRRPQREHIHTLSDDEWDPEASPRTLRITGTRRQPVRVRPDVITSDDEEQSAPAEQQTEESDSDDDATDAVDASEADHKLLSLLSLRSPGKRRQEKLADLRVRALLDPHSAAAIALRARERGQDVFTSGEGVEDDDEDELEDGGFSGDDDWESDPEGWKVETQEEAW